MEEGAEAQRRREHPKAGRTLKTAQPEKKHLAKKPEAKVRIVSEHFAIGLRIEVSQM